MTAGAAARPELSIVLPCLDEAATIERTLLALLPLRERGAELIVVDGGSRDDTLARARPWADRLLTAPRGRARQMNAGAHAARGAVLLFLHADTLLPAVADHAVHAALDRGALWGRFDVRIEGQWRFLPVVATLMNLRSRLTGIATGDQAIFVRREVFDAVGGYPEQPLMEDIALSARLKRLARPACLHVRVTTSGRRWDEHGPWRTILLMWRLRLGYWLGESPERLAARYR
ncbi:MAG: TIGR04283 family arsenosugar biosynthesis glycosyltransferase [Casimicrobiaceae bacterium]